jgi:hypothetical protein
VPPRHSSLPAELTVREALERVRSSESRTWLATDRRGVIGVINLARLEREQAEGADKKLGELVDALVFPHVHPDAGGEPRGCAQARRHRDAAGRFGFIRRDSRLTGFKPRRFCRSPVGGRVARSEAWPRGIGEFLALPITRESFYFGGGILRFKKSYKPE